MHSCICALVHWRRECNVPLILHLITS